jgi:dihydrolipoamide dehydrogenase
MVQKQLPKSLLVIGSGAIGIEFASMYAALGTKVTIVEIAERILMQEDAQIAQIMNEQLQKKDIEIYTKSAISIDENELKKDINSPLNVTIIPQDIKEDKSKHVIKQFDRILSAVGVIPNTDKNLRLNNTKVQLNDRGYIIVDQFLQTSDPSIYAIGDITEPPYLAHKASHEGILCAEKIATKILKNSNNPLYCKAIIKNRIPSCIYSSPEVASIGVTEEKAKLLGLDYKVGIFPFRANGKALAIDESEGMVME